MNLKEELSEIKQRLATERDELRLKAHLFSAEVGEEWEDIEKKWDKFIEIPESDYLHLKKHAFKSPLLDDTLSRKKKRFSILNLFK